MGYNKNDFSRIRSEYAVKYLKARQRAEERMNELHEKLPEVFEIDSRLAGTGNDIMNIIRMGGADVQKAIDGLHERNDRLVEKRNEILVRFGYPTDYTDVKYECPLCSDSGYTDKGMCVCMKKALILAGYASSGIGELIKTQDFDNFSLDYYKAGGNYELMKQKSAELRRFAEGFSKGTYINYLFVGATGLGKTHLSTSVAKKVIERGFDVMYVTALGLVGDFEMKRFGNGEADTERYYTSDLLIIDDLGTEVSNQFTLSCMYDVINSRINARKSTIISTNLEKREIEAKYTERITSRLFGEYYPIPFVGTDIRRQKISMAR